ncbi:MAG: gliding motility-associated C-terminal domain-containing protein [Saprospiraceae bacterium]|nr:gliding motility-associated C-terminal domain-containing protein [Saprospiraceae bacterium]
MKNIYLVIFGLALFLRAQAQQSPFPLAVIATSGAESTTADGSYTVSSTLGEAIVITLSGAVSTVTQGFQQGELLRCQALNSTNPAVIIFDPSSFDPCAASVSLSQQAYAGITPQWFKDGIPVCNDWTCTGALDLGFNTFVLTLSSTGGCANYDTATLVLPRGQQAVAVDDEVTIYQGTTDNILVNLSQNDQDLEQIFQITVNASTVPSEIIVTPNPSSPGTLFISAPKAAVGDYEFTYNICNNGVCQTCTTGRVRVKVSRLLGEGFNDGITPNGDEKNDMFVLCRPCPTCEPCSNMALWVYSRWGDLVFQDEAYANTWGGTSTGGKDLPAGTYFYYATINKQPRTGTVTILR